MFNISDMIPDDEIMITPHVFGGVLVAWSPDGSQLSTANLDGRMMLWDTKVGNFELLLDGTMPQLPHLPGLITARLSSQAVKMAS